MHFDAKRTVCAQDSCAVSPCRNKTALIIPGAAMAASIFAAILPAAVSHRNGTSGFAHSGV